MSIDLSQSEVSTWGKVEVGLDSCGEEEQRSAVRGVDGTPAPAQSSVLFPEDFSGELSVYAPGAPGEGAAVSVQDGLQMLL